MVNLNYLLGKTLARVEQKGDDVLLFETVDGEVFQFFHSQDCCERVAIESVVGDLHDLVGEPLLVCEAVEGTTPADYKFGFEPESYTWTFYKFATRKGYVDIRWLGTSNGYYSEGVSFEKVEA